MLSLSQAAKQTGKSKSVISRALENGKLTALKNEDGSYAISPADLFAVFPEQPQEPPEQNAGTGTSTSTGTDTRTTAEPHQNTAERAERALEALTETQAGQVDDLRNTIADLQSRLDQAEADRRKLEDDRRQANESQTRQVDQLSQLLAMKEKSVQKLQHQPNPELERQLEQSEIDRRRLEKTIERLRVEHANQTQEQKGWFSRLIG